jgi:hypothetical protein
MRVLICASLGLLVLAAPLAAQPSTSTCRGGAASFALGERYSERLGRRARRAAGARVVRKVEPGSVYTIEFRADRLNLDVAADGTVRAVRCG